MNDYVINTPSDFNLKETLECGQCFHFNMLDENEYVLTAYGQLLHIRQDDSNLVFYDTDEKIYDTLWRKYFDIDRDYGKIKEELLAKDDKLKEAICAMSGVRILYKFIIINTSIINMADCIIYIWSTKACF